MADEKINVKTTETKESNGDAAINAAENAIQNDGVQNPPAEKKPEKVTLKDKAKGLGKKVVSGAKKALPYVGAFVAGAGACAGALLVLTRPDGTVEPTDYPDLGDYPEETPIDGDFTVEDAGSVSDEA